MDTRGDGLAAATRPRRRRGPMLAAATIPWLVAGGLLVAGRAGAQDGPSPQATATPAPPEPAGTTATGAAPADPAPSPASTDGDAPARPHARAATVDVAVLATARRALGDAGLTGMGERWAVDPVVVAVRVLAPDLVVVEVAATVLRPIDGGWGAPVAARVAVPVDPGPPLRVLGPAWPVSQAPVAADPPPGRAAPPDAAVVVTEGLAAAGWTAVEVHAVDVPHALALRARVDGTGPDGVPREDATVWLTPEGDVLGQDVR